MRGATARVLRLRSPTGGSEQVPGGPEDVVRGPRCLKEAPPLLPSAQDLHYHDIPARIYPPQPPLNWAHRQVGYRVGV